MKFRFRARPRPSLFPSSPPIPILGVGEEDVEGVSPAWAGGLILSGWARPAGEGVWEAELPEEEAGLLASPVGIFAFLARRPWGPHARRRRVRGVLIAPIPGWSVAAFLAPPIWGDSFPEADSLRPEDLENGILVFLSTGWPGVLTQLGKGSSRLVRGDFPRYGFGSPLANLAAWAGQVVRLPGGSEALMLALLRLRGTDPEAWRRASVALAPILGGWP